jgi:hypothetical protein
MGSLTVRTGPASVNLPIVRGDDVAYPIAFYTAYTDETTNTELDITGRTYVSSIAATKGGSVVTTATVTVTDAANGKITWSLTDTQTDALTGPRYTWDLIENPGTSSERTLIIGELRMTGRATA